MSIVVKVLACLVLVMLVWFDLRDRRLPNLGVGLIAGFYLVQALLLRTPAATVGAHMLVACVAFAIAAAMCYFGWMGGGDVKMIGALALWLPGQALLFMLIVMSLIGGVLTMIMMFDHWRTKSPDPVETPYGVAIAMASMVALGEPLFNHFT